MNRVGTVGAVLAAFLVFTGCGSTQTGSPNFDLARFGLDSADGQVGPVRLISVFIASPGARGSTHLAGNSAALLLTIANDGQTDDLLTGASAEAAEHVVIRNGDAAADRQVQVPVPAGGVAVLREVTAHHLELSGLRETLRGGLSVPVTFRFRDAGVFTLEVPVRTYTDVPVDRVPQPLSAPNR
jgi:periplasmic copper chaperone A